MLTYYTDKGCEVRTLEEYRNGIRFTPMEYK